MQTWSKRGVILEGYSLETKVYPHQTPSPAVDDSDSGLSRPQEDNAGAPQRAVLAA